MKIDYTVPYCAFASVYASQISDTEKKKIEIECERKIEPVCKSMIKTLDDKVGKRLDLRA